MQFSSLLSTNCQAWRWITLLTIVSWLLFPDGEPSVAKRRICHVPRQNTYFRWPILRCRRHAHMERAAVQPKRYWAITDYFQWTCENILILRRIL